MFCHWEWRVYPIGEFQRGNTSCDRGVQIVFELQPRVSSADSEADRFGNYTVSPPRPSVLYAPSYKLYVFI